MINLVLLHGWGCDSRSWQPLMPGLEKIARVTTLDLPGFGESPPVPEFTLDAVIEVLAERLPDNAVLVGWSLGAMLGVQLAARYPAKVRALVCIAANARFVASDDYPTAMPAAINREFNLAFARDPQGTLKRFYGLVAQGDPAERSLLKGLRALAPAAVSSNWQEALALLNVLDNRETLTQLSQPVLHLQAQGDALVPAAAAPALAAINPAHTVITIPEAAHALHWSQPERLCAEIELFLRRLPSITPQLDKRQVARSFGRAAATYDSVAQLQRDVGRQLFQYLPADLPGSTKVMDLGAGTGFFTRQLASRYPDADILGVDIAEGMLRYARQQEAGGSVHWLCGDAEQLPLADASLDLVFSSLAIQWCENLQQLMGELKRVLAPGGHLLLATLGPNTLHELKSAWQQVDRYVHVNQFQAQDSVRLAAVAAGLKINHFAVEQRVLHFDRLTELTRDLKALGAHNINAGKPEGLTGRQRIAAFRAAYEGYREAAGLPATYEVFYLSLQN